MLLLFAGVGGILLGLRFTVVVLVPICLLGTAVFMFCSLAGFGQFLLLLAFIQAGYILGLVGREPYAQFMTRLNSAQSKRT